MEQPLVTIIITTYNYAHTVGSAIDSALAQDYRNLEVLVVDNASTDGTPGLVERYARDPRFRYLRNDANIGMVPNHNKGLREARGALLLFLSADDFLLPGHISRSYAFLRDRPEIDVLYTSTYFVNEREAFTGMRQMSGQPLAAYAGGRNEFAGLLTEGCYMCFPTMLMRRELFDRFGELDEGLKAADYEIVVRWAANGVRFAYVPEPSCAVRLHSGQQSSAQNYVADAGDIREFVYLLQKFVGANGARLDGFESSVSRHAWGRYNMALQAGVRDEDGAIKASLLEIDALLAAVRDRNAATPRRRRPTVVVLPATRIDALEVTLRSLAAQTLADWDALVVEHASVPYAGIAGHIDPAGRMRPLRLIGGVPEGMAINTALRVAGGEWFVVLRPGSVLPPEHLERLASVFAAGGAQLVRTTATAGERRDVFMPPSEPRLPFSAPFGPIESLAFTRTVLDRAGPFNDTLAGFAEWEFYLRASLQFPVAALDSPVAAAAIGPEWGAAVAGLPPIARAIHGAFVTEDASIRAEREAYLRNLERALTGGTEGNALVRLMQAAYGAELLAGTR